MSETVVPPALPPAISTVEASPFEPPAPFARLAACLLLAVIVGDWFFWGHPVGASLGGYALVLSVLVILNRQPFTLNRRQFVIGALLVASAVQTAICPSMSNTLVLGALLIALAGDTCFVQVRLVWTRWAQALLSAMAFVVTWIKFLRGYRQSLRGNNQDYGHRMSHLVQVSWLAVVLFVVFGVILSIGNATLGSLLDKSIQAVSDLLFQLNIPTLPHWIFWGILASFALILLVPRYSPQLDKLLTSEFSRITAPRLSIATQRSLVALAAVNLLFFLTNSLDVVYLWMSQSLPEGVSYSAYVHKGVYSLIVAVVLSAVILALIFQQERAAVQSRWLKGLALFWIAQNLFLVLGVLMRLHLYVDAHWLTPKRVYVALFLLLVTVGYVLLARHILKTGSLKQLLLGNAAAVFVLFFTLQFINVPAYVADYNYRQWLANPSRNVTEMHFDTVLGREIIPLLVQVANSGLDEPAVADARRQLTAVSFMSVQPGDDVPWQSWQWRQAQLLAMLEPYAPTMQKEIELRSQKGNLR